jgi:hypothetical protein
MVLSTLSAERRTRVLTVGIAATVSLYALVLVCAEPLRSFAASSSSDVAVSLIVANSISNSCTSPVSLGTITRTGDTSVNVCAATGYCSTNKTVCTVVTNNSTGYALSWLVSTGTGSAGARTGTGWLNGFASTANRIAPLGTGSTTMNKQPIAMVAGAGTVNNDARWAARLSSTSTTVGGAGIGWGTDGTSDTWLRVATGSAVNIANRATQTSGGGDTENIGFRAIIHGTAIIPTDTYKATVTVTATTNP